MQHDKYNVYTRYNNFLDNKSTVTSNEYKKDVTKSMDLVKPIEKAHYRFRLINLTHMFHSLSERMRSLTS